MSLLLVAASSLSALAAGLLRCDGYEFRAHEHDATDPGSLSSNEVRRVRFANRAAEAILARRAGLVQRMASRNHGGDLRVLVSELESGGPDEQAVSNSVFVYEPTGGPRRLPEPLLRQLYGLTAAEARLTGRLFMGQSLVQAARSLGVTSNTAKSTLKRVFAKCAVGSQAELVQLLSLGPRTL